MSIKRLLALLKKEFFQGPKNFIFIYGIVAPIAISLVVGAVFGVFFGDAPRLGVLDQGDSRVTEILMEQEGITASRYESLTVLREAVANGALDMGLVLPEGFDTEVESDGDAKATAYVWGQSQAQQRALIQAAFSNAVRDIAGQEPPIDIQTTVLGSESLPWEERIVPLVVLMAIVFTGAVLPATSLVDEKEKRTVQALLVTPLGLGEIFLAKGLLGFSLSLVMGLIILTINQAFGSEQALLVLALALGSVMAAQIGLILGMLAKDITSLFAVVKFIGILLYAPALVHLIPGIPEWIGRIFPTYYIIQPVIEISQQGGGWAQVGPELAVLAGLDLLLAGLLWLTLRRVREFAF